MHKNLLGLAVLAVAVPLTAEASSTRNDTLRATIEQSGHYCDRVAHAQKDILRTSGDRTLWYVDCDERRYQVLYDGDSTPEVRPLLKPRRPSR